MHIEDFSINPSYLVDVQVEVMHDHILDRANPTEDDIMRILQGQDRAWSFCTYDHPIFHQLRQDLERQGFIHVQQNCCNGDRVLVPFRLNGWLFQPGRKFPGAAALGHAIASAQRSGHPELPI